MYPIKDSQDYEAWQLLLWHLIRPDQILEEHNPKKLLMDLRVREKSKLGDQAFLEAILRVIGSNLEELLPIEGSRELIDLGILFTGMGYWELSITDRDVLSERLDLDAVDAVIQGVIVALSNINVQELETDVLWLLKKIKCLASYDLDAIEDALKKEDEKLISQTYIQVQRQLFKLNKDDNYGYFHNHVPNISIEPMWELAKDISLSSEALIRALEHPSEGIRRNAALLLLNGAGGDEGINLIQKLLEDS